MRMLFELGLLIIVGMGAYAAYRFLIRKVEEEKKDDKGFTLIELMIVIAIIGILASIAIQAFMKYKNSDKSAPVVSHSYNKKQCTCTK